MRARRRSKSRQEKVIRGNKHTELAMRYSRDRSGNYAVARRERDLCRGVHYNTYIDLQIETERISNDEALMLVSS